AFNEYHRNPLTKSQVPTSFSSFTHCYSGEVARFIGAPINIRDRDIRTRTNTFFAGGLCENRMADLLACEAQASIQEFGICSPRGSLEWTSGISASTFR